MNIITRNFFRLLRSGALNEYEPMEPMSAFKWRRLDQMVHAQHVERAALKGIKNHQFDEMMNIPEDLANQTPDNSAHQEEPRLSNHYLNFRLSRIENAERHAIDTNVDALNVLKIIVGNVSSMLNHGTMLSGIIELGSYLRNKGDKVDFVKLDKWLSKLRIQRMAQLQGSVLILFFDFEQDEIPYVRHVERGAYKLTLRSLYYNEQDRQDIHFNETQAGFVHVTGGTMRKNLRRSMRYLEYAPIETISNFCNNFFKSLSEIEE